MLKKFLLSVCTVIGTTLASYSTFAMFDLTDVDRNISELRERSATIQRLRQIDVKSKEEEDLLIEEEKCVKSIADRMIAHAREETKLEQRSGANDWVFNREAIKAEITWCNKRKYTLDEAASRVFGHARDLIDCVRSINRTILSYWKAREDNLEKQPSNGYSHRVVGFIAPHDLYLREFCEKICEVGRITSRVFPNEAQRMEDFIPITFPTDPRDFDMSFKEDPMLHELVLQAWRPDVKSSEIAMLAYGLSVGYHCYSKKAQDAFEKQSVDLAEATASVDALQKYLAVLKHDVMGDLLAQLTEYKCKEVQDKHALRMLVEEFGQILSKY